MLNIDVPAKQGHANPRLWVKRQLTTPPYLSIGDGAAYILIWLKEGISVEFWPQARQLNVIVKRRQRVEFNELVDPAILSQPEVIAARYSLPPDGDFRQMCADALATWWQEEVIPFGGEPAYGSGETIEASYGLGARG